jgi:hypothetical protein
MLIHPVWEAKIIHTVTRKIKRLPAGLFPKNKNSTALSKTYVDDDI